MSQEVPQGSQNEEVDLGQLFNMIGKLFDKFFKFDDGTNVFHIYKKPEAISCI